MWNIKLAPATVMSDSFAVIWDKPNESVAFYHIYLNDKFIVERAINKTHYTFEGLQPDTKYTVYTTAVLDDGNKLISQPLCVETAEKSEIIDVSKPPYSAVGDGITMNTIAIQKAIDDCKYNGTVVIPDGLFLTGALRLKSNMALRVDGELMGSSNPCDYLDSTVEHGGRILSRYEGWEVYCHKSLINIGYINQQNRREVTCQNVHICGRGRITGGGTSLRDFTIQMAKENGWAVGNTNIYERTRGKLVSIVQSRNIHLTGVQFSESPCWTIHIVYSDTVTTHGVKIYSNVLNGDGWDPDSSKNCLLFDCEIKTGDDCIAVKSGKNPEGNIVNIPSENIEIFDTRCGGGHGLALGSEISGGIKNVKIRDCVLNKTIYGLQLKGTPERGGYITDLDVQDCTFNLFLVKSNVSYNSDGEPAQHKPYFQNFSFHNVVIEGTDVNGEPIDSNQGAIEMEGYDDDCREHNHCVNNVVFSDLVLGCPSNPNPKVYLKNCENIAFRCTKTCGKHNPEIIFAGKTNNIFVDVETIK